MNRKALWAALGTLALVLALVATLGVTAQTPVPKQGKFRGMWGVRATGTSHEIEKGHVFFVGTFSGVFFNDVANGFLDKSSVECPGVNDIVNGLSIANHGYCIVTDKDGDKAFLVWKGKDSSPNVGGGEQRWTGGTGKYAGLSGNSTYRYTGIGTTPAYAVVWDGEWRIP